VPSVANAIDGPAEVERRTDTLFHERCDRIARSTDRMFAVLLAIQWAGGIVAAVVVSPRTWAGLNPGVHVHVWSALICGGVLSALPVFLALRQPGLRSTRYTIAVSQMLWSALLIHLTGGRIETHFHVFGSLAFLAMYRDWKVLIPATVVVALDHAFRGIFWPQSVYGVLTASPWVSVEHAAWVVFEDIFLIRSCRLSVAEMWDIARQRAQLENTNELIELKVRRRTDELKQSLVLRRGILDGAADGIVTIYENGAILSFNRAAEQMFGYTEAEVLGASVSILAPASHRHKHGDSKRWFLEANDSKVIGQSRQVTAGRQDGSTFPMELAVTELESEGARMFVGICRDITERQRLESQLLESNEDLRAVNAVHQTLFACQSAAEVGKVLTDAMVRDFDAHFARVWLARPGDLCDQCVLSDSCRSRERCLHLVASSGHYTHLSGAHRRVPLGAFKIGLIGGGRGKTLCNDVINDERVHDRQWAAQHRLRSFAGFPLERDGQVLGVMAMFSQRELPQHLLETLELLAQLGVSALSSVENADALAESNREFQHVSRRVGMAEVATSVLHNVGNVLNSVNVSASLVTERLQHSKVPNLAKATEIMTAHAGDLGRFMADDERGRQLPGYLTMLAAHLAEEQSQTMSELRSLCENVEHIKAIVSMQQSYAGRSGLIEKLDAIEVMEGALRMIAGASGRHGIEVVREYTEAPAIAADKHKLLQILVNLVRNAKHALVASAEADKRLTVRIGPSESGVRLQVIDNGVGIPTENLSRIFAHGFTTKDNGHGFGLHSSALAAKEMNGALIADSAGPGAGAIFTLELPLEAAKVTQ
jgi:PAS domain S-box-containing protein